MVFRSVISNLNLQIVVFILSFPVGAVYTKNENPEEEFRSKPRLPFCPTSNTTGNETIFELPDSFVNYRAIPKFYTENLTLVDEREFPNFYHRFHILISEPCGDLENQCSIDSKGQQSIEFRLLENGSLYLLGRNDEQRSVDHEAYCLQRRDGDSFYTPRFCDPEFCSPKLDSTAHKYKNLKYFGALLSVPFLIVTVIIYSVLPELKNIHGNTLRVYLCCLILTYVVLAVDRLPTSGDGTGPFCLCRGFIIYFAALASFLWLNVVSFDMWHRFGGLRPMQRIEDQPNRRTFVIYSVYVWGVAVALTAFCIVMEFAPGVSGSIFHPGFSERNCWFSTKSAAAIYFYGPIGATIACNMCLFVSTSVKLIQHKKETSAQLNDGDSKRHDEDKQWFVLYLKLFVLMGVSWSTEIISWLWKDLRYLWYATDLLNVLQGLFIFIIFVCKKNIWRSLVKLLKKQNQKFIDSDLRNDCTQSQN